MMELDKFFSDIEKLSVNKKVVLLEDCTNKQAEITEICLDLKVELECFVNASNALEAVTRAIPDLLIVDWRLPGSQDGISFIKSIREKCSHTIPILFFTEHSTPDIRLQSIENHATVFFDKAEAPELFIAQIKSLLNLASHNQPELVPPLEFNNKLIPSVEWQHFCNFHAAVKYNCRAEVTIPQISQKIKIEEHKLRSVLQNYLNVSPQKYLTLYRLHTAGLLLKKGISIKEISSALGYANTANFSNVFKKTYQLTPAQYQKVHLT